MVLPSCSRQKDLKDKDSGFYLVLVCIAGGIIWSIVNMVGSYKDSVPNYDVTDCVIYDYASATSTASEDSDLYESLVDSGAISVEDGGDVSVVDETAAAEETTAETTAQ